MISAATVPPPRSPVRRALDLIFPPRCVDCGRPGHWVCPACWPRMPWLVDGECIHCSRPVVNRRLCTVCSSATGAVESVRPLDPYAVTRHSGISRQAVHELKYTGHTDIASLMGGLMASRLPSDIDAVVVPVPLHWSRRRRRGFNQSDLLARAVAKQLKLDLRPGELKRWRRTKDQVNLGPEERRTNVFGAFRWTGGRINLPVLLVDDVFTTGSTLNACAQAVAEAGAKSVDAIVFACAQLNTDGGRRR